jgi:hypothetical protein
MSADVYSIRMFAGFVPAGQTITIGTVPAQTVWVLVSVQVQGASGSANYFNLLHHASGTRLLFFDFGAAPTGKYWTGRIVLTAGEQVDAQSVGSGFNVCVSGYQLGSVPG